MEIDHIGYLCNNIDITIEEFEKIGYTLCSTVFVDADTASDIEQGGGRNVYICFMKNGTTKVELVSPLNENSDIYSTIKRQGEGPYHICYKVPNLEKQINYMKTDGYMLLKRPAQAVALNNAKVAFLFRKGVGIIELVEENK